MSVSLLGSALTGLVRVPRLLRAFPFEQPHVRAASGDATAAPAMTGKVFL
ncbi:hypothetical protein ACKI1I_21145 [Streptomyces turgidiscabies]|uniref:Uncharacterized protein n=1 Tax=Streptomyces turgidiscabies (strain Car8) TaxID=698760 RepID=L7FAT8_STRT8|nr:MULTISPECIES: hypothetical protein [Streptomyces]ELP67780.1 hypothetical protein STRTUCAR8_10004 [Streptomyces turgidiscabies Car8]MDX3496578.1 hypothetical protein [Streptomyces turgidiscabies]GAQ72774.1 hypothetical protein T45_04529 [Streptomyces turgidiscabies]